MPRASHSCGIIKWWPRALQDQKPGQHARDQPRQADDEDIAEPVKAFVQALGLLPPHAFADPMGSDGANDLGPGIDGLLGVGLGQASFGTQSPRLGAQACPVPSLPVSARTRR